MARLIYSNLASLDLYIADEAGDFGWAMPDEAVHQAVNDLMRPAGTHLYGRRLYEVMTPWETLETEGEPPAVADFQALWRAADKIVYSRTLKEPASARTRIEREFRAEDVARLKAEASRDLVIGGPHLAAEALRAGLVDDIHLFVFPVLIGGGNRAFPEGLRLGLTLVGERRFANGVVHLHYRVG